MLCKLTRFTIFKYTRGMHVQWLSVFRKSCKRSPKREYFRKSLLNAFYLMYFGKQHSCWFNLGHNCNTLEVNKDSTNSWQCSWLALVSLSKRKHFMKLCGKKINWSGRNYLERTLHCLQKVYFTIILRYFLFFYFLTVSFIFKEQRKVNKRSEINPIFNFFTRKRNSGRKS